MRQTSRHNRITELIGAEPIYTQEELRRRLTQVGFT